MPYYVHDRELEPECGRPFPSARDASQDPLFNKATETITYVASHDETAAWEAREQSRFDSGEYQAVPWEHYVWQSEIARRHYAHRSRIQPGMIAYTKSDEHGHQDRQTTVRPMKYLQEYFVGLFTATTMQRFVGECAVEELKVTDDPAVIQKVYEHGPTSCMSKPVSYFCSGSIHPVRVYGKPGDLALAYFGPEDGARARAIVWPEKKIYSRIYGSEHVMLSLLKDAGYVYGSLAGARIRAISHDGQYVMPYVDGVSVAYLKGKFFVLGSSRNGDTSYDTQRTDGVTDDGEADTFVCNNCNERIAEEYHAQDGICQNCWSDEHFDCADCNDECHTDTACTFDNSAATVCESCYREDTSTCEREACNNQWHERDLRRTLRQLRVTRHVTQFCPDCADDICSHCTQHPDDVDRTPCVHCTPSLDTDTDSLTSEVPTNA